MGNISIKVDLLKFDGALKHKAADGVEWLMIPIEYAQLFNGEKGVYADMTAIPLTNPAADRKDTHLVKQAFSKEKFAAMSDEEKKAVPILGNCIVWPDSGAKTESKPTTSAPNKSAKPSFL